MKKLAVKDRGAACMNCLTCENACAQAFYKKEDMYQEYLSCIHIVEKDGKIKVATCLQCGVCAKACEHEAIKKNAKGVFTIDAKACKNCGKCIEACPLGLVVKAKNKDTPTKCIACGICAKQCPMDILYIKEE
jgi:Fe-S-cluster-containing hydrogenase component 2